MNYAVKMGEGAAFTTGALLIVIAFCLAFGVGFCG